MKIFFIGFELDHLSFMEHTQNNNTLKEKKRKKRKGIIGWKNYFTKFCSNHSQPKVWSG